MIPFSPPKIDKEVINEVVDTLKSGWITTGPKVKLFEKMITEYCGNKTTIAVNSCTSGLQLVLDWFGIQEGDEVIIPAYTYCATANVVHHSGARIVMADINNNDFNISVESIRNKITERTKAIICVDFAGYPCDYSEIYDLLNESDLGGMFTPSNEIQDTLGRILLISDSAHSFGSVYNEFNAGTFCDISVFSFHAVKNLTTAEGGAICFDLPQFNPDEIYKHFNCKSLHGQNKSALEKQQLGNWRYDVLEPGFKCNMTDVQASIGIGQLKSYKQQLKRRQEIFYMYDHFFSKHSRFITPLHNTWDKLSSYHIYPLRINLINEQQRDLIVENIFYNEVSVNVHFIPLPMLTAYKKTGFNISDYPNAYSMFENEISLPVYFDLTDEQVKIVCETVLNAMNEVLRKS